MITEKDKKSEKYIKFENNFVKKNLLTAMLTAMLTAFSERCARFARLLHHLLTDLAQFLSRRVPSTISTTIDLN